MILSTHLFCLLNLSTTPQFCPPLLLSYTFDVLNLIRQQNQPNTIHYLLCTIYYALCTMHYLLCTMHYALFTMHYALCIRICTYSYVFVCIHTYLYVFICIYYFRRIHTYSLFHVEIRRNLVILVLTRSSRRIE